MELRVKLIEEGIDAPPYDPNRYKNHYFYSDFDILKERMTEGAEEGKKRGKKAK